MTCKDCLHFEQCYYYGNILDPLHGGVICEYFKNKADFVEVVRCKDCRYFREYTKDYKQKVENADGDCYFRVMYSVDEQFGAVQCHDFCSYGERKDDAENG